jgi:hypothetical protein
VSKINISEDEYYPFYKLTDRDYSLEFSGEIPDEKLLWIEKTMAEFDRVQQYLEGLIADPTELITVGDFL